MTSSEEDSEPELLLRSEFTETNVQLSPDRSWVAHQYNESGQPKIHVQRFRKVDDGRLKVSNAGGVFPLWLGDGQKLFYLAAGPALLIYIAVPVEMDPAFDAQNPLELFKWLYFKADEGRTYDVSPNGQRFLAINPVPLETDADASLPDLVPEQA